MKIIKKILKKKKLNELKIEEIYESIEQRPKIDIKHEYKKKLILAKKKLQINEEQIKKAIKCLKELITRKNEQPIFNENEDDEELVENEKKGKRIS